MGVATAQMAIDGADFLQVYRCWMSPKGCWPTHPSSRSKNLINLHFPNRCGRDAQDSRVSAQVPFKPLG